MKCQVFQGDWQALLGLWTWWVREGLCWPDPLSSPSYPPQSVCSS